MRIFRASIENSPFIYLDFVTMLSIGGFKNLESNSLPKLAILFLNKVPNNFYPKFYNIKLKFKISPFRSRRIIKKIPKKA